MFLVQVMQCHDNAILENGNSISENDNALLKNNVNIVSITISTGYSTRAVA